jgi:hypothetical protein
LASFENELRLIWALGLNAAVLVSAWRFVKRRQGGDVVSRCVDTGLLYYLVQYLVIGGLGLVGLLTPGMITLAALLLSAGLWLASMRRPSTEPSAHTTTADRLAIWGGLLFVAGYAGAFILNQRYLPPQANDALTYHLPAAVQWLQTHRLGLYQTWFYNPANTYSPLAGSMFIAWLIAPMGNDVLARFVEAGPLLLIYLAMLELMRRMGAGTAVAALLAVAACISRPMLSQVVLAKDDLFLAAFFIVLVVQVLRPVSRSPRSVWRAGIAAGLLLATKYTALFSLPLLLLLVDAPWRVAGWRWRHWLAAGAALMLLAGPWYWRNWLLTGNPLYPTDVRLAGVTLFDGMFTALRSDRLEGTRWWGVLTRGYYGLPLVVTLGLLATCLGAILARRGRIFTDPLLRLCVIGPPVGLALFVLASPYAEIRFVYPSLLLLFACAAGLLRAGRWSIAAAIVLAMLSGLTAFSWEPQTRQQMIQFLVCAAVVTAVGMALVGMGTRLPWTYWRGVLVSAGLVLALMVYVHWNGYIKLYRQSIDEQIFPHGNYGELGQTWAFVRTRLPPRARLAYANTYLIHPLYGFDLDRPVEYAPTRPGVWYLHDLGRFDQPTTGEHIPDQVAPLTWQQPSAVTWLANLEHMGAEYLLVGKRSISDPGVAVQPPELTMARSMPQRFERLDENSEAAVYRIRPR